MNIYERIKEDHDKHRGLAGGLGETSGDSAERRRLFELFKAEVESHAAAEEQTFYAELLSLTKSQEQARHSISEHEEAASILAELAELDMASGGWLQKFKKLKDELEHHMEEEEEEVFELARSLISEERAIELGDAFAALKSKKLKAA